MHEEYGWKAYEAGIFTEWREEVSRRLTKFSPKEYMLVEVRDDISKKVFHELVKSKKVLQNTDQSE
jgi:hypothetical protein